MGKRREKVDAVAGGQQPVIEALRANVDALEQQAAYWRERFEASRPNVGRIDRLTRLLERWLTGGSMNLAAETRLELYGDEEPLPGIDRDEMEACRSCGHELGVSKHCDECRASA
jgi:hypothetical protein